LLPRADSARRTRCSQEGLGFWLALRVALPGGFARVLDCEDEVGIGPVRRPEQRCPQQITACSWSRPLWRRFGLAPDWLGLRLPDGRGDRRPAFG